MSLFTDLDRIEDFAIHNGVAVTPLTEFYSETWIFGDGMESTWSYLHRWGDVEEAESEQFAYCGIARREAILEILESYDGFR